MRGFVESNVKHGRFQQSAKNEYSENLRPLSKDPGNVPKEKTQASANCRTFAQPVSSIYIGLLIKQHYLLIFLHLKSHKTK